MSIDAEAIKESIDIVDFIGQYIELKKEGSGFKGLCPFHSESTPSFNVNPALQSYKCFGCGEGGDVIEFVMKQQGLEFKEACAQLGGEQQPGPAKPKQKRKLKKKAEPATVVKLTIEAARDHYTKDTLQGMADYIFKDHPKEFVKAWKYLDEDGMVELVACRFEDKNGKKSVLSIYWDGKSLKMAGYPVLLYNRDRLKNEPEKDVLIVYGEKCAEIADSLGFIGVTWNGGEKKIIDADLSPLENRTIFCWTDDDEPGEKTTVEVIKRLPHVQVVEIIPALREIEPKGADIAEAMEFFEGDIKAVTQHIYNTAKRVETDQKPEEQQKPTNESKTGKDPDQGSWPFTILGIADDNKAYFIGANDRMLALNPTSISKTQLMNLINVEWWRDAYGKSKEDWEDAISDLIYISSTTDFDPDRMRGRGAWRESDGRICYHDGKNTLGEFSEERIYLRRAMKDIGINDKPATAKQRMRVLMAAMNLTFESKSDCVRTLAWAILAPFAGALPWRPAGLLTASSESGKSTIVNRIIKPLAAPEICSGGITTEAGIRHHVGVDSCSVVVEEAETDTPKKRQNRDDTFSLMRQSTTDDSPDAWKGTQDGKGTSYTMRSMFFFVAISPEVDAEADENRIFRVGLTKPKHTYDEWESVEAELVESLSPEICRSIRAYTWANLAGIIKLSKKMARIAQKEAGISNRLALADSLLLSAFVAVFYDSLDPSDNTLIDFIKEFYGSAVTEKRRNENEEMLDLLLDWRVKADDHREYTIREMLYAIQFGRIGENEETNDEFNTIVEARAYPSISARRLAGMHGIGLDPDSNIAIAKNHPEIMKRLEKGRGYHLQLGRHPRCINKGKNVSLGSGNVKNCVVIGRD